MLIFAQLQEILLFHPIFSYFVVYIFFLCPIPNPTCNCNLVYCLFPLYSLFCSIFYSMHLARNTFTTSGSSPINIVIFNSLIWNFTLFKAGFYGFHRPVFLLRHYLQKDFHPRLKSSFYLWDRLSNVEHWPTIIKSLGLLLLLLLLLVFIFLMVVSPLLIRKFVLIFESNLLSEILSALCRMSTVPSNAAFCKQLILMGIPIVLKCFTRLSLIAPRPLIMMGITVSLMLHNLCNCNLKSSYL